MANTKMGSLSGNGWRVLRHLLSGVAVVAAFSFLVWKWPAALAWERVSEPARLGALVGFVLLFSAALILRALRWHWLMGSQLNVGFYSSLSAYSWFFFVGGFTPMRSGEILRIGWVKERGGSGIFTVGAFLVEKLSDVMVLLLLLGLGVTMAGVVPEPLEGLSGGMVALIVVGYLLLFMFSGQFRRWLVVRAIDSSLASLLERFLQAVPTPSDGSLFWRLHGLTLAVWGVLAVGFMVYLDACYPGIHWSAAPVCLALVNLSALVGGSPGNLGVYEAMFALVLKAYGIDFEQAIVAAVMLHSVTLVTTMLLGLGFARLPGMVSEKN